MLFVSAVAFLMQKRAATTQKCLLGYQRTNGEKDLRYSIDFVDNICLVYVYFLENINLIVGKYITQTPLSGNNDEDKIIPIISKTSILNLDARYTGLNLRSCTKWSSTSASRLSYFCSLMCQYVSKKMMGKSRENRVITSKGHWLMNHNKKLDSTYSESKYLICVQVYAVYVE